MADEVPTQIPNYNAQQWAQLMGLLQLMAAPGKQASAERSGIDPYTMQALQGMLRGQSADLMSQVVKPNNMGYTNSLFGQGLSMPEIQATIQRTQQGQSDADRRRALLEKGYAHGGELGGMKQKPAWWKASEDLPYYQQQALYDSTTPTTDRPFSDFAPKATEYQGG